MPGETFFSVSEFSKVELWHGTYVLHIYCKYLSIYNIVNIYCLWSCIISVGHIENLGDSSFALPFTPVDFNSFSEAYGVEAHWVYSVTSVWTTEWGTANIMTYLVLFGEMQW